MSFRVVVRRGASEAPPIVWPAAGDDHTPGDRNHSGQQASSDAGAGTAASEESLRLAHAAGFREGEAAGRSAAQADLRAALERLARSAEELSRLRPRLRDQAEQDLVKLAVAIARRVLHRELTVDPNAIGGLVKMALEQISFRERVRLRVHPQHESAIRACLDGAGRTEGIEISGDAALTPGSVIFETARGDLDASAEAQLAEIERGLTDRYRENR